ncbi:hypothetical protein [Pelagicoccus sp. SDUM812005]|uniref:hypothetical protein n=1 Tax=Pelagicoccus sp. SDUM812005 TaxID=3041257 RepID=UPI00280F892D|nr:hypothetical protein [Pelagicoccus sp. SDUM812005]MDQ8183200.1 hypothetical protein [Pelagicoccus sp. SDUM812005]
MTKTHIISIATATLLSACSAAGSEVSFGGFFSNGYIKSSANNYLVDSEEGDFDFAEVGLNATWSPLDRTTVRGQVFAFEVGPYGNFDPLVDYLFVDYSVNPAFGFRLGRIKRSEGIYTDIQDIDVARTTVLLPTGMYDARYRDFSASVDGASLYGNFQAGNHSFEYTAYHGEIDLAKESGVAAYALGEIGRGGIQGANLTDISANTNSGAQLWWYTPLIGLRFGASYTYYDEFTFDVSGTLPHPLYGPLPLRIETIANAEQNRFSAEYFLGDWTFVSEYNTITIESSARNTVAGAPGDWEPSKGKGYSWYLSASRRFLDKFEAGLTFAEYVNNETRTSNPIDYQKDTQLSLRYNATDFWTLKAEFHMMDGTNRLFNQLGQNAGALDSKWNLIATKSTFSF